MRRDYFTLDVDGGGNGERPVVTIEFDGPTEPFERRLTNEVGEPLEAGEIDFTYRLRAEEVRPETNGVFAVTNRITGDYVLEANADAGSILDLVEAARVNGTGDGDDRWYRVVIRSNGQEVLAQEKTTFLVYDVDGDILRNHSLIPSGVEL